MSESDKKKHSERIHQKKTKLNHKMDIARAYHQDHVLKNPHKYHKTSLFNCGNANCIMCMNPRRGFGEKTIQERKFEQSIDDE